MIEFSWMEGDGAGFEAARAVRHEVFVKEQGYSLIGEFDAQDADSFHIIGREAGVPVCTARMFWDGDGLLHIGRVAVLPRLRGRQVGLQMMAEVVKKARPLGAKQVVLNSQADKTAFYEKAGFAPTGKTSLDEGVPHAEMAMTL